MEVNPIGIVQNGIENSGHAGYRQMESVIRLSENLPSNAFEDLSFFSHLEIIFYLNLRRSQKGGAETSLLSNLKQVEDTSRSSVGLFGTTIVRFIKKEGKHITVLGLDASNGTHVIDIKPVMGEFMPKEGAIQTNWEKKIK